MNQSTLRGLFTDLVILAGLASLFYGLHLYEPWIAFTAVGGIVTAIGVVMAR